MIEFPPDSGLMGYAPVAVTLLLVGAVVCFWNSDIPVLAWLAVISLGAWVGLLAWVGW